MKLIKIFNGSKNGIGPVVATVLLLIVAVVAVTGFGSWFSTFSSNLETKSEIESMNSIQLDFQLLQKTNSGLVIYVKNPSSQFTKINEIKVDGLVCNLISSDIIGANLVTIVDVDCTSNVGDISEVSILTSQKMFSEKLIVR